jgi:hypothetical protein
MKLLKILLACSLFIVVSCEDDSTPTPPIDPPPVDTINPPDTIVTPPTDTSSIIFGEIEGMIRKENSVGFLPEYTNVMFIGEMMFLASEYYTYVENYYYLNKQIVYPPSHPQGIKSWDELYSSRFNEFLLSNGDYRSLGVFNPPSSTVKRIIRALNTPTIHVARSLTFDREYFYVAEPKEHVILEAFDFTNVNNWIVKDVVFAGMSDERKGIPGPPISHIEGDDNIITHCAFPNIISYGIGLKNANNNVIQCNYFRAKKAHYFPGFGGDLAAVVIRETSEGSRDNVVIMNEGHNLGDFLGTPNLRDYDPKSPKLPGTIVSTNWIWSDEWLRHEIDGMVVTCSEDGIDLKTGGLPNDPMYISNNMIWGHRPTNPECGGTGSSGAGIVLHNDVQHIELFGNIIWDVTGGFIVFGHNKKFPNAETKNVDIYNNLIYDIVATQNTRLEAVGAHLNADSLYFYNNSMINVVSLFSMKESDTVNDNKINIDRLLSGNVFINSQNAFASNQNLKSTSWTCNLYYNVLQLGNLKGEPLGTTQYTDLSFWVKPWSNPEYIILENVIPVNQIICND